MSSGAKPPAKRTVAALTAVVALLVIGSLALYFYTTPPSKGIGPNTTTLQSSSTVATSAGGYQDSSGQPQGAWAAYLGYVPSGYVLSPHYPIAAVYPCPSGMDPAQCAQFKASCGNGVCDPNESCATCPIDCGVSGQLTCDPYTGRAGAPISICQVGGAA